MDAALTGLFVEARPGPALEDHIIQALRTRTQTSGLRLPVPGWLAVAAAAVLLIGFTGAVASQWIVAGGLPFPGTSRSGQIAHEDSSLSSFMSDYQLDVSRMAQVSREKTLEGLDAVGKDETFASPKDNALGYYPPARL